jgi:uncharacterized protein YkwD
MLGFTLPASTTRHSLRIMRTACISLALAAVVLAGNAGTLLAWDASAFSPDDEQLLMSLTNQDRVSAGLNALVNDSYLDSKAEWRAQDMGDRNYFSHQIPPDNSMVFSSMQNDGYCFQVAGENIGLSSYGDGDATSHIEIGFMNSPSHRDNIMGRWTRIGVGAYKAADGRKLYAVLFSLPCGAAAPDPTPAPVAPDPTPAPVAPKPVATPKPVVTPIVTPEPTPAPTATPSPTPTEQPTPTPSPIVTPALPIETPVSSGSPDTAATATTPGTVTSLRVHQRVVTGGPIDSLFHSLFGGLFGW